MDLTELYDLYPHKQTARYGLAGELIEMAKKPPITEEERRERMKQDAESFNNPIKIPKKL